MYAYITYENIILHENIVYIAKLEATRGSKKVACLY